MAIAHRLQSWIFGYIPPLSWRIFVACASTFLLSVLWSPSILAYFYIQFTFFVIFVCVCHYFLIASVVASKKVPCSTSLGSFDVGSSKAHASKEVQLSTTTTDYGILPYFKGYDWCSSLSEEDLTHLKISYDIPWSISFELPPNEVIDGESYALNATIIESFLRNGFWLSFICLVHDILDFIQIAYAQLHAAAWYMLMSCYVVWRLELMLDREDYPNLIL